MFCLWFKELRTFCGTSQESKSNVNKRLLFLSPWVKQQFFGIIPLNLPGNTLTRTILFYPIRTKDYSFL